MKKADQKLYNLIFPVWMLLLCPPFWILALPLNFCIDLLVLWLSLRRLGHAEAAGIAKKVIVKTWICGFLADFVGIIPMLFGMMYTPEGDTALRSWWYNNINTPVAYHPFRSIAGFLWVAACVLLAGFMIYWLNKRFCLKNTALNDFQKKKIALTLAIFTAPYLFFLPTQWFF